MDQVDEDIQILDGLIARILTLSWMELRTQVPDMEPIRLDQLISELQGRFGPMLDQTQLALETIIEGPVNCKYKPHFWRVFSWIRFL